ncbi:type 11 methyltransferase [Salinisphaera shabanensis T35B1]|uniref:Ubiquinone-menaquinone biosynthesis methyltransferase protein n=1 Tax=Salinisphaera shabanensis E1L3A TaxID=1033802 RepID=F7QCE7_9GAMM|nr:class I SAM-dependent methyltransferase [Salinisphaera shabanensis]ERJ18462.1 ubiquinone-menaquinone biosynthesis methyltransferase protein [Salinisphaera shabanensis E1L3A]
MALNKEEFRQRYARLAPFYDGGLWFYRAFGLRIDHYRRQAVSRLHLLAGETVVDLGCGTGLNFKHLQEKVGPRGRIIGVDLTPEMLSVARRRVERAGWLNVELVAADMTTYRIHDADAVLATLALSTVASYETLIECIATGLPAHGRIANFELQWPDRWPKWLGQLGVFFNRPAGVTSDIVHRRPAEAIKRHFTQFECESLYWGAAYVCSGWQPKPRHISSAS